MRKRVQILKNPIQGNRIKNPVSSDKRGAVKKVELKCSTFHSPLFIPLLYPQLTLKRV